MALSDVLRYSQWLKSLLDIYFVLFWVNLAVMVVVRLGFEVENYVSFLR